MIRTIVRFLSILLALQSSFSVAGAFTAYPVKLYIDSQLKTEVLRITNRGADKVTVQIVGKAWGQDTTGDDLYDSTKDIVFFPVIVDIEKDEERIVRVGYQGKPSIPKEKTYRLFIEELPVADPGELSLNIALRLSIPVFIKPEQEIQEWAIGGIRLSGERLKVTVTNNGTIHLIPSKITATGLDGSGRLVFTHDITGWYVLAGANRPFELIISREECLRSEAINVVVQINKEVKESTLNVDRHMCTPKIADSKDSGHDAQQ